MSEKTEQPTDKKLKDARNKGQTAKSQDLVAAAVLGAALLVLAGAGPVLYERMRRIVGTALEQGLQVQGTQQVLALLSSMALDGMAVAFGMLSVSVLIAVLALMPQVGGLQISFEPLTPKFENLNPAEGFKKMFNARSFVELAKAILKAAVLGAVLWQVVTGLLPLIVGSAYLTPLGSGKIAWSALLKLFFFAFLVFLVVGPVDYGIQKWLFVRDQRMSKDDVKREHKDSEGDPHLKGHLKSLREEMATTPPQERVPGATVVVTNPTHYAVALRYTPGVTPLPVVVAKGMDREAAVIRALAAKHNIPLVANPPLARALHKLPLDQPIPEALFEAVSVVLRWVAELDRLGGEAPPAD